MFAFTFFAEDLESEADLKEMTRSSTANATKNEPKTRTQVRGKYNPQFQYLLIDQNQSFVSRLGSIGADHDVSYRYTAGPVVQRADKIIQ